MMPATIPIILNGGRGLGAAAGSAGSLSFSFFSALGLASAMARRPLFGSGRGAGGAGCSPDHRQGAAGADPRRREGGPHLIGTARTGRRVTPRGGPGTGGGWAGAGR